MLQSISSPAPVTMFSHMDLLTSTHPSGHPHPHTPFCFCTPHPGGRYSSTLIRFLSVWLSFFMKANRASSNHHYHQQQRQQKYSLTQITVISGQNIFFLFVFETNLLLGDLACLKQVSPVFAVRIIVFWTWKRLLIFKDHNQQDSITE